MLLQALIAVSSPELAARLREAVSGSGLQASETTEPSDTAGQLSTGKFDVALISRALLARDPAPELNRVRALTPPPAIVVFQDDGDAEELAQLLAAGCHTVLPEDLPADLLRSALKPVIERQRSAVRAALRVEKASEQYSLDDFISESSAMQTFVRTARKIVRSDSTVLLLGETGVGKGRLARALHEEGPRSDGPFVTTHCAALPEGLLESELFGHEAGAFTGASKARKGYFEMAHGGTLFLDEIGDVPSHIQVKLLTAIEEQRVQRLGAEKPVRIDVRIIAATNRDLELAMRERQFRADLFYRLSVVTLTIPPLRSRKEDIDKLVLGYLEHFRQETGRRDIAIEPAALELLREYEWPGNVRQLINAVERAVLLCSEDKITMEDLPRSVVNATVGSASTHEVSPSGPASAMITGLLDKPLTEARAQLVGEFEKSYLTRLLQDTGGRISATAERAGVNQRHLYDLMRRHSLSKESFKKRSSR